MSARLQQYFIQVIRWHISLLIALHHTYFTSRISKKFKHHLHLQTVINAKISRVEALDPKNPLFYTRLKAFVTHLRCLGYDIFLIVDPNTSNVHSKAFLRSKAIVKKHEWKNLTFHNNVFMVVDDFFQKQKLFQNKSY